MLGKRKRSLQLKPERREPLRQVLSEQIDLEIALKRRLLAVAHARLQWGEILRSSLVNSDASRISSVHSPAAYRDAALAVYEAIEAQCQLIFLGDSQTLSPWTNAGRRGSPAASLPDAPRTRKRVTLTRGTSTGPILFEDRSTQTPVTLKLVCTDCTRSDFPTIQGFLNHCRLAHSRVYGTHDECIQATGIPVDYQEREALLASGIEISTIHLPSIKGMFERAVGLMSTISRSHTSELFQISEKSSKVSTHLSQTLGLHKDTPTLAPFLGKQVKKKCIHVYDDLDPIDITSNDSTRQSYTRAFWPNKHQPRRNADDDWAINLAAIVTEGAGGAEDPQHMLLESLESQVSRFHVTRRVVISDRSLYLPEHRRPGGTMSHTHRWQIAVSSPSYGQHITTFLSRLSVTCATHPPIFAGPISVSGPPFIVCHTANRPFLAHLTFEWVGEQNQPLEVDHWVELDQLRTPRPVLGEEQMFDIELDRNTAFLPVCDTAKVISWNGDDDHGISVAVGAVLELQHADTDDMPSAPEPEHIKLLKSIVPRFPMTMQDFGTRQLPTPPYILYPSRVKLLNLVMGRRKALEWSRALAIRTQYDALPGSEDKIPLTTADVYRWLGTQGLFTRPQIHNNSPPSESSIPAQTATPSQALAALSRFCSTCGVNTQHHTPGDHAESHDSDEIVGYQCQPALERRRAPIVHVYALLAPPVMTYQAASSNIDITSTAPRDLVLAARPCLTRFVHQEVASLPLSCLLRVAKRDTAPLFGGELSWGKTPPEVDQALSIHALLALTLGKLVKDLIGGAVKVAREMQSRTKVWPDALPRADPVSLLTPTHVLQGLLIKDTEQGGSKEALFKCFSRVGTLLAGEEAPKKQPNFLQLDGGSTLGPVV